MSVDAGNLHGDGDILLLSCYELGHVPAGITWPTAFLRRAGFAPKAIDLAICELDEVAVRAAKLVAISVPMHTALRLGVPVAQRIRSLNAAAHICFHGLYAQLNREWLLGNLADSCLGGESEQALVALAQALARGEAPAAVAAPLLARQDYPIPDASGLTGNYAELLNNGHSAPAGFAEATRGCKYTCRHCPVTPVYNGRFFAVPVENVLQQVRTQVASGAQHITFGDPDFLNGPRHALRVVKALHAEFPLLTFDITAKVEHLVNHADLLPQLAECGCLFIVTAVESLSNHVLEILDKGHTRADVEQALAVTRAAGITLRPSLVAFTPWTTLDDYLELFEFAAANALVGAIEPVQFTIRLLLPPKSALLEHPQMVPHLRELRAGDFGYRWEHPDSRLDALHREAVAVAEQGGDDAAVFPALWSLARSTAGQAPPLPVGATPGPRLSESWYCCAEPSLELLQGRGTDSLIARQPNPSQDV